MWLKEYYEVLGAATKKAQAYTDQEVSKVRTKFAVVASYADLPSPGRTDTIYLVPKSGFVSVYDQYIYENDQYTDIGDTELDLDSYATDLELSQGLATKVDKVEGYGLSKNDFTDAKDTKLAGIETGAQVNVTPDAALDKTSTNTIQNKAVTEKFEEVEAEILNEDKVAEGNPITIETGSIGIAKSTELTMSPIQDLHGYGKSWVGGMGKNLLPYTIATIKTINDTATWNENVATLNGFTFTVLTDNGNNVIGIKVNGSAQETDTSFYIYNDSTFILSNIGYILNGCPNNGSNTSYLLQTKYTYGGGSETLKNEYGSGTTFTPASACILNYVRIVIRSNTAVNDLIYYPMICLSTETDVTFAPYENICPISGRTQAEIVVKDDDEVTQSTVTISFGQTVYGGTLDVETGSLTIEWVGTTIDGDAVSTVNGSSGADSLGGKRIDTNISGAYYAGSASSDAAKILSDKLEAVSSSNIYSGNPQPNTVSVSGANIVVLRYDGANTKEDAQAKLNANPVQVCYKLATPTTTTLTAAQVNLIKGLNNISTDADSIKMTYTINDFVTETEMDTALESKANVIDLNSKAELTSFGPLEVIIASTNYAEGDYMIFEGKFCKASSAITAGDTLEIGTNLTETTIAAELLAIISQLPTT